MVKQELIYLDIKFYFIIHEVFKNVKFAMISISKSGPTKVGGSLTSQTLNIILQTFINFFIAAILK